MTGFKAVRNVAVAACVAIGLLLTASGALAASPIYLCINEKAGGGVKSGGVEGKCPLPTEKVKYTKVALPREESEQKTLLAILSHAKYVESGVGGKPTIQFSGVNVQVVSGAGKTNAAVNGTGNLVIGYDENGGKHEQTGSHNLILGEEQTFTSFGGIVAGFANSITGEWASVTGGDVSTASGPDSSVTGGRANLASGIESAVSGGDSNIAGGERTSVSGGNFNKAENFLTSISGGNENEAKVRDASISGGRANHAEGAWSSIFGGKELTTTKEYEAIP
jgi:hypothetical protein